MINKLINWLKEPRNIVLLASIAVLAAYAFIDAGVEGVIYLAVFLGIAILISSAVIVLINKLFK